MSMDSPRSQSFESFLSELEPPPSWPPPGQILHPPPPPPSSSTPLRPSKKRARASRRAPTTVLTTDTSNFRAMVQEFTGIPSPPFPNSSSSVFSRPRLDLFRQPLPLSTFPNSSITSNHNPPPIPSSFNLQPPIAMGVSPWPPGRGPGYQAGELGSVIAAADSINRLPSCKTDNTPSTSSEMPTVTRGDAGMDIWHLSSD